MNDLQLCKKSGLAVVILLSIGLLVSDGNATDPGKVLTAAWTEKFDLPTCSFSTTGRNQYFVLEPEYQLVFDGIDGKDTTRLVITVLDKTQQVGNVETGIVEEKETINGKTVEISRNYFAFCSQTNSVFYFGEDVDMYKDGKIVSHDGSWRADSGNARPGLMMPGVILLGARYYQEVAPGTAMDRAEIVRIDETLNTPAGKFTNCLKTEETTPLEPKNKEYKLYAPGVGLVKDGELRLTKYGFVKR